MTTPILKLPEIAQAQTAYLTHNQALRQLEVFVSGAVVSRTLTIPPTLASPTNDGAIYIPAAGSTGVWAGKENYLALWSDNQWFFYTPITNSRLFSIPDGGIIQYDGTIWVVVVVSGDMSQAIYDTNSDGIVDLADQLAGTTTANQYYGTNSSNVKGFFALPTQLTATQIRDALSSLTAGDRLDASAIKNLPTTSGGSNILAIVEGSNTSITANTDTSLSFNTEITDPSAAWLLTNPDRFTASVDGYYHLIIRSIDPIGNTATTGSPHFAQTWFTKNTSTTKLNQTYQCLPDNSPISLDYSITLKLDAGDYLTAKCNLPIAGSLGANAIATFERLYSIPVISPSYQLSLDFETLAGLTPFGGASLSTDQFQSGAKSLLIDAAAASYAQVNSSSTLDIGIKNWLFETSFRISAFGTYANGYFLIFNKRSLSTIAFNISYYNNEISVTLDGSTSNFAFTPSLNTWYKIKLERTGALLKYYLNNTLTNTVNIGSTSVPLITDSLRIGGDSFNGSKSTVYYDDLSFSVF